MTTIPRLQPDLAKFNPDAVLPYELRIHDFQLAMQDVYDFFYDVNSLLTSRGLQRFDDMLRLAIMSGLLSDMLTASLATHARLDTEPPSQRASGPCGPRCLRGEPSEVWYRGRRD